jgi:hypothetical protein
MDILLPEDAPQRLDEDVIHPAGPRPSIELWMPDRSSGPVRAMLVNWLPRSALKICALPLGHEKVAVSQTAILLEPTRRKNFR